MSGLGDCINDLGQYSWMPKTSEEQLNLGLELINYAYRNHYTTLENEVLSLNEKIRELSSKLRESERKLSESSLVLQDLTEKNTKLTEENERLTCNLRKLKVENTRLQNLANTIKSTINNEAQQIDTEVITNTQPGEPLLRNTNRAQQLINQIEISLQHNSVKSTRTAGEGKALGATRKEYETKNKMKTIFSPSSSIDVSKRLQFPKFSSKLNQFSRNINENSGLPHEHYTQNSRGPLDEAFQIENFESRKHDNGTLDSAVKSDKGNSQYEGGRSFFKEARKILPFDKFNYFLQQIKLMNKGQKSKESIIRMAEELFSRENYHILETFKQLINNKPNVLSLPNNNIA